MIQRARDVREITGSPTAGSDAARMLDAQRASTNHAGYNEARAEYARSLYRRFRDRKGIVQMKSPGLISVPPHSRWHAPVAAGSAVVSAHKEAAPQEPGVVTLPVDSPKLARIGVAAVTNLEFASDEVTAPGRVEANPNRISKVVMPVGGRLRQVLVRLGDAVTRAAAANHRQPGCGRGHDRLPPGAGPAQQARSLMGKSEKDLTRLRELYDHRAAALKEVQSAENDLAQAQPRSNKRKRPATTPCTASTYWG